VGKQTVHALSSVAQRMGPNPALNRTRNGVPRLRLISFWPKRVPRQRAGELKRSASEEAKSRPLWQPAFM
jgi:hypothetical protein